MLIQTAAEDLQPSDCWGLVWCSPNSWVCAAWAQFWGDLLGEVSESKRSNKKSNESEEFEATEITKKYVKYQQNKDLNVLFLNFNNYAANKISPKIFSVSRAEKVGFKIVLETSPKHPLHPSKCKTEYSNSSAQTHYSHLYVILRNISGT